MDKRTDIWAFGVVLYELLVGESPFRGDVVADVMAAVLTKEPEWGPVPIRLQRLLATCLQKDPGRRMHDIADFGLLLDETPAPAPARQRTWLPWSAAVVLVAVLVAVLLLRSPSKPAAAHAVRFQFSVANSFDSIFALSPDGRRLAYTAGRPDGRSQLWVRSLDSLEAKVLPGTENAGGLFWSSDSHFIAFSAKGKLKKIDISGGPPLDVCDLKSAGDPANERPGIIPGIRGGSWSREGTMVFGSDNILFRVPAEGGTASPLTALDPGWRETYHARPVFLRDGRHFLYLRASSTPGNSGTYVGSVNAKIEDQGRQRLIGGQIGVGYVASDDRGPEYLVFLRNDILMAQTA